LFYDYEFHACHHVYSFADDPAEHIADSAGMSELAAHFGKIRGSLQELVDKKQSAVVLASCTADFANELRGRETSDQTVV
jgi:hypothetical protein